jgi:hypothetical protein
MTRRTDFIIGDSHFSAVLGDNPAPCKRAPAPVGLQRRGDEIYFSTGLNLGEGDRETVDLGDVGFWPPGRALCLFYGPTPMSGPGEIRPASAVIVLGKLEGDPESAEAGGRTPGSGGAAARLSRNLSPVGA